MLLTLCALALAAPGEYVVTMDVPDDLTVQDYEDLLERAAASAPPGTTAVRVLTPDGRPLDALLPPLPPVPEKQDDLPLPSMPVDHPGDTPGSLSDKAVYLSQCHGWIWYETLDRFSTQRGNVWDTVEDFHNPEALNQYLTAYLENAGAAVFTVKERDLNPEEAWADDGGAGYSESGDGFTDGPEGWGYVSPIPYGTNPFVQGTTRRLPADGGAVATWQPEVPVDGHYAVYVSWDSEPDNTTAAHYRITHPGGVIDRYYDQTRHGSTWQYVENLWLTEGASLTVELIGDSGDPGTFVIADAVRIGGGMGVVSRHGETTGRPRWEEGAILGTQLNGAPTSVYDPWSDGDGSDPTSRSLWAAWEHPTGEDAIYVSWHSNAYNGEARGTTTYTYTAPYAVEGSVDLADHIQDEVMTFITTWWDSSWNDRGLNTANFAEVNPNYNPEMPAALIEQGFHDNETDVGYIKQPEFRQDTSRAIYRAIVRYFAERDGTAAVFLPEPPVAVSLTHVDGELVARWQPGPSGAPYGDAPSSYLLYTSADGKAWDNGTPVSGTETPVAAAHGEEVYVRVAAVNDGGTSFPSEVVGALRALDGDVPVLVVGAFDRMDSGLLDWDTPNSSLGPVVRMDLRHMNAYDTTVATGRAIARSEWPFDTTSDEALPSLDTSGYRLIVWVAGEESTEDESFSHAQQAWLRQWVADGGALWSSGSEVLWDLDARGDAEDLAFAQEVLGATLADDNAGTTLADGAGLLQDVGPLDFGRSDGAPYPVEWPDVLASQREVIATYADGSTAGVLGEGVAHFGFPFECIGDPTARDRVAAALLPALVPDWEPPEDVDTGEPDTGEPGEPADPPGRVRLSSLGCGCEHGTGATWWLLPLLAVGLRRRR